MTATAEMADAEEPAEVFEPNAYDRLTTLRLVIQGRRIFEEMRRPLPTAGNEYRAWFDRAGRRAMHEAMNASLAAEALASRLRGAMWAAGEQDYRRGDYEYRKAKHFSYSFVCDDPFPNPGKPHEFTEEKRAEFRAWFEDFKARQQTKNEEN
jgi:hypothetical protein